jgi:hypothetical protein
MRLCSDFSESIINRCFGLHIRQVRTRAMVTCGGMLKGTVYSSHARTGHVLKEKIQSTMLLVSNQKFNVQWTTCYFRVTRVCEPKEKISVPFFKYC